MAGIVRYRECGLGVAMAEIRYRTMARPAPAAAPLVPPLAAATPAAPGSDRAAAAHAALDTVAPYLRTLMLRNVASDGFPFVDPTRPGVRSLPGCVIASPSYVGNLAGVDQDYIHNWTRDSALAAMEIRAAEAPLLDGIDQTLIDYVRFARQCQLTAPRIDLACFTIAAQPRTWTDADGEHIWSNQSDGPALRTMAVLRAFDRLDEPTRDVAREVIAADVDFLLRAYRDPTTSLWEEDHGQSFFARSVQLRCLTELGELAGNSLGIPVPEGVSEACDWLRAALDQHWDGRMYLSVLAGPGAPVRAGCDPNIDIVLAALYGAVPVTDSRLLATAGAALARWAAPDSDRCYPINLADQGLGIGPLLGRYPDDTYDGDVGDDGPSPPRGGHPWAVSTAAFAELCYRLAGEMSAVPDDRLCAGFLGQVGVSAECAVAEARARLAAAADRMLAAVLFHSDHFELSEQFDAATGYEKSVANLTWSYSSFLSALRARAAVPR